MTRLAIPLIFFVITMGTVMADRDEKEYKDKFNEFKQKHGKKYKDEDEEDKRFKLFKGAMDKIDAHNKEFDDGKQTFQMGITRAADMTDEEIEQQLLGRIKSEEISAQGGDRAKRSVMLENMETFEWRSKRAIPASFDWRKWGAVTKIKDQGYCGSCWAFSAAGVLESHNYIRTQRLVLFSEQHLVDCVSSAYSCLGCDGGLENRAMQYVKDTNNNINTDASYPYKGVAGTCHSTATNDGFTPSISSIAQVQSRNETALMAAISTIGPVSAAIYAPDSFQYYKNGVFSSTACGYTPNHAVIIVGYDTDPTYGPYWIVKNSYGTGWGEYGYIRIARNKNMCNIALENYYPRLA